MHLFHTKHPRLVLLVAAVAVLASAVAGCAGPAEPPAASVTGGGLLLGVAPQAHEITVRGLGLDVTLEINWPDRPGRAPYTVVFDNIVRPGDSKITVDGQPATAATGPGPSVRVQVSPKAAGTSLVRLETPEPAELRFVVIGDSQGRNEALAQAADMIAAAGVDFIVHLGDMTTFGQEEQYAMFRQAIARAGLAFFPVPGNHDVRGGGTAIYTATLAPMEYELEVAGWRLLFVDTSTEALDEAALAALAETIDRSPQPTMVFTHVPPFDPLALPGEDPHALLEGAAEFKAMLRSSPQIRGAFFGHIHMFHHRQEPEGPHFVISGGGGARLYAGVDNGGFHHFLVVTADQSGNIELDVRRFEAAGAVDSIVVRGPGGTVELSVADLSAMDVIERSSAFENQYGNIRGQGVYRGVRVADLVELVGGMRPDDQLEVHSNDGYHQTFAYANVYTPSEEFQGRQGDMAIAFGFGETAGKVTLVPEWPDGPRVVFFPEDELYSNDDCRATSPPGMGWAQYQSAGARWARHVVLLEVIR